MFDFIETQDSYYAVVDVAGGVPTIAAQFGPGLMTIVDNGAGDFTLNLAANFNIPLNRRRVRVTPRTAAFAIYVYDEAGSAAGTARVRCFDAAAMALDNVSFFFELNRLVPSTGG